MRAASLKPRCLCIDIETSVQSVPELRRLAAFRADTGQHLSLGASFRAGELQEALDRLTEGAAFVLGHNIRRHDLPILRGLHPGLALHALPVVDTLELSPIAFPRNPYHRLVKDYKLVRDAVSDPLRDAQLALRLWREQFRAFEVLGEQRPEELACHHYLLTRPPEAGAGSLFATVRRALAPTLDEVRGHLRKLCAGKACGTRVEQALDRMLADSEACRALAYVLAWLQVAGGNSVLPPWVRLQYPEVRRLVRELRETSCGDPACAYCATWLDPKKELTRWYGHAAFRAHPPNATGGSLQEDIARAVYAGRPVLAILPTGGGKSLCYQLPALSRHWRTGALTVVISPLQSLMKDQVDNLVKQGIYAGATLNGLLSMPERRDVLDKIRLGDVGILFVSPEQFRNRTFVGAIRQREIAAWVFDEAHCLSKWGHDFRPDYLYVSRFIRENYGSAPAPLACFTATARREVIADIAEHLRDGLGVTLEVVDGGLARDNLHYEVMPVQKSERMALVHRLLEQELGRAPGGAVVFAASRKGTEDLATYLKDMGWAAACFHAGLEAGLKKDIQQAFIAGDLRVIVATNAFGMGVDKPDVRMVIHADIPGSLENYLQEAGRAGRDGQDARCILLYDAEDVEAQFGLSGRSRLSRRDIAGILRALRRHAARARSAEVVLTAGEILAEEDTGIDPDNPDADTKVRIALAWLERSRFLTRNENQTRVFPASLKVGDLNDAKRRLERAGYSEEVRQNYLDLVEIIINAPAGEGITTDELMLALALPSERLIRMLQRLEQLGVLSNDLTLSVLLRKGVQQGSKERLARLGTLESALLSLLPELAPEAGGGEWQEMSLRGVCAALRDRSGIDLLPEELLILLRSLTRPFGDRGQGTGRGLIEVRVLRREALRVRLLREWSNLREIAERRRAVAAVLLEALLGKLDPGLRGVDLRVEVKLGELAGTLRQDTVIGPVLRDELAAIDAGLLYLHDNGALILDRGRTVFRSAMTIRIVPEARTRAFTNADFAPLGAHYQERILQIHVVQEYARLGLERLSEALAFVLAYFALPRLAFIRRYFAGRKEMLERATTEESYRRIVTGLCHPIQEKLVAAGTEPNRLILAGPGAGKTRVIVHRVAYLVRVLREPPEGLLVLSFNHGAVHELRRRLVALIGRDAGGVTVLTYHALALRLTGVSLVHLDKRGEEVDFDRILDAALALLEGRSELSGGEPDRLRERLLAGYRHILVDEYQDIDTRQYALIGALAGRTLKDPDAKLSLLAVGDDDQNIYAFRGTKNEFIHRFQEDYRAQIDYLVENYRSTRHIIDAANRMIAQHRGRMKAEHPIRVNHARTREAPGGRFEALDALTHGRVHRLVVPHEPLTQAEAAMAEVRRIHSLSADADWSDFAVLARKRATLEPVRAWCEIEGLSYTVADRHRAGQPKLHQIREGRVLLALLERREGRRVKPGSLVRWHRRHKRIATDNPWQSLLGHFIEEVESTWPEAVPARLLIEALFEFGAVARRSERGRITLSTVHGAKGREFRHVVILDGGDWTAASDEERRLYYVGMTRARDTLTLCESERSPNPFSPALGPRALRSVAAARATRPEIGRRYCSLGMKDVDLGHAGRCMSGQPIHAALAALEVGDALRLVETRRGRELVTPAGVTVGRLASGYAMPPGQVLHVLVESLVWRTREQTREPEHRRNLRMAGWWVVLPQIVVAPAQSAPASLGAAVQ